MAEAGDEKLWARVASSATGKQHRRSSLSAVQHLPNERSTLNGLNMPRSLTLMARPASSRVQHFRSEYAVRYDAGHGVSRLTAARWAPRSSSWRSMSRKASDQWKRLLRAPSSSPSLDVEFLSSRLDGRVKHNRLRLRSASP